MPGIEAIINGILNEGDETGSVQQAAKDKVKGTPDNLKPKGAKEDDPKDPPKPSQPADKIKNLGGATPFNSSPTNNSHNLKEDGDKMDKMKKKKGDEYDDEYDDEMDEGSNEGLDKDGERIADKDVRLESIDVESVMEELGSFDQDLNALFKGQNLTEGFESHATVIFENAVRSAAKRVAGKGLEQLKEQAEIALTNERNILAETVDRYITDAVKEWGTKNEIAIEYGIRSELTESFLSGMHSLFTEHYVDIPEDRIDIVEELEEQIADNNSVLKEEIDKRIDAQTELNAIKKMAAIMEASDGLTESQSEKLSTLVEDTDYDENFERNLGTLKESYFRGGNDNAPAKRVSTLNEHIESSSAVREEEKAQEVTGLMEQYINTTTGV